MENLEIEDNESNNVIKRDSRHYKNLYKLIRVRLSAASSVGLGWSVGHGYFR